MERYEDSDKFEIRRIKIDASKSEIIVTEPSIVQSCQAISKKSQFSSAADSAIYTVSQK